MKLTLIRHTAVAVPRGVCYGQTDVALSETFPEEAECVARQLTNYSFDRVYTSPLSRCVGLAERCGFPDAVRDERLMEMNFGDWEMCKYDEISDARLQQWFDDFINVAPTGGESCMQQRARFLDFINTLRTGLPRDASVALFTHGGILIHALNIFGGKDYNELFRSIPPYGSIVRLTI